MANGKVEAMMVCESFGKILSTNKFSFGKCESSDNSSESFRVGDWYNSRTTFTENANNITLEEIMDGKWLLSSTASVNGADLFFFYRVSSD